MSDWAESVRGIKIHKQMASEAKGYGKSVGGGVGGAGHTPYVVKGKDTGGKPVSDDTEQPLPQTPPMQMLTQQQTQQLIQQLLQHSKHQQQMLEQHQQRIAVLEQKLSWTLSKLDVALPLPENEGTEH
jgi:hypothetical protein